MHGIACKQSIFSIFRSYNTYFQCYVFSTKVFTRQCEKEDKELMVSNFALLLVDFK